MATLNELQQGMAERLRDTLKQRNMTQRALAHATGVSPQAVNKWLQSGHIGRQHLLHCAELLDVPTNWLLTGEQTDGIAENSARYNVKKASSWVPLLERDELPNFLKKGKLKDSDRAIGCPVPHSSQSFALQLSDDDQFSANAADRLTTKDWVVIDPKARQNRNTLVASKGRKKSLTFASKTELGEDTGLGAVVALIRRP